MTGKGTRTGVAKVAVLFDECEIARRVQDLADAVAEALPDELVVVGILKGSFVFVADLVRALGRAGRAPRVEFIRLSSYGYGKESTGEVRQIGEVPAGLAGQVVLLVDDIADTGLSLAHGKSLLEGAGAARVWTCAAVDKPSRRRVDLAPDFVGFTIGDRFVVGYGIDLAEQYRHLPYIGAVD